VLVLVLARRFCKQVRNKPVYAIVRQQCQRHSRRQALAAGLPAVKPDAAHSAHGRADALQRPSLANPGARTPSGVIRLCCASPLRAQAAACPPAARPGSAPFSCMRLASAEAAAG
jgi:hypothetical protein